MKQVASTGTYVMDLNGQNTKKIFASFAGTPHWSPDGNFVVLMGQQTIWIVSKDEGWKEEVTGLKGLVRGFSLSK
jgi:hypothetical protein